MGKETILNQDQLITNNKVISKSKNYLILQKYIPEESISFALNWIDEYKFNFKITRSRNTKLGDFTPAHSGKPHKITVNHDLNKYAFLITLTHEVAHLIAFNKYRNKIMPHGREWKEEFRSLLVPFISMNIFPDDIVHSLKYYSQNPKASSCTDIHLIKALKKYDNESEFIHLEDIPVKSIFRLRNGREFLKGERIRKRYKCTEVRTRQEYLVSPVAEVIQTTLF
ncbi:MAG: SprT-like domain-containing protein [Ignavibacteria bacterium]